jgi:hypothetical protein
MMKEHAENPLMAYTQPGTYHRYLDELQAVFTQLKPMLKRDAHVVVEVSNLRGNGITTLAWDVGRALSRVLRFEGEVVVGWRGEDEGEGTYGLAYLTSAPSVTATAASIAAAVATVTVSTITSTSGVTVAVVCIATTPVRFKFLDRHVGFLVDFLDLIFGLINLAVATNLQTEIGPKQSGVTVLKYVTFAYFHFFDTIVPKRDRDYSRTVADDSILYSVRFAVTS